MTDITNILLLANLADDGTVRYVHTMQADKSVIPSLPGSNVLLTEEQYAAILAGGSFRMIDGTLVSVDPVGPSIGEIRASAASKIDRAAEVARLRYITPGAGQIGVYVEKSAQARAFVAAYPDATAAAAAAPASWPYLAAETGITATTLFGVAVAIDAMAQQWTAAAALIEAARLGAKAAIAAATTEAAIASIVAGIVWPAP